MAPSPHRLTTRGGAANVFTRAVKERLWRPKDPPALHTDQESASRSRTAMHRGNRSQSVLNVPPHHADGTRLGSWRLSPLVMHGWPTRRIPAAQCQWPRKAKTQAQRGQDLQKTCLWGAGGGPTVQTAASPLVVPSGKAAQRPPCLSCPAARALASQPTCHPAPQALHSHVSVDISHCAYVMPNATAPVLGSIVASRRRSTPGNVSWTPRKAPAQRPVPATVRLHGGACRWRLQQNDSRFESRGSRLRVHLPAPRRGIRTGPCNVTACGCRVQAQI